MRGTEYLRGSAIFLVAQLTEDAGPAGGAIELVGQEMGFAGNDDKSRSIGWGR